MKPLLFLATLSALALPMQAPAQVESEPLPADAVALLDGDPISKAEYLDYLYSRFGKRGVQDMVGDLLIQKEAAKYDIKVDAAKLEASIKEREAAARQGQDDGAFLKNLQRNGQSYELYLQGLRRDLGNEQLLRELVRQTRVATDDRVQQLFERQHGLGGTKMEVRHVLILPNMLRAELVRGGTKPADINMNELKISARDMAADARARIAAGEEFASVAADVSHDRVTKDRGGVIENYNGRLYGPDFRAALDGLTVQGETTLVESGSGYHVVQLMGRTETKLADVREEIVKMVLEAEPTFQEMSGIRNSLVENADLRLW
jgi:peptidyl-prolyl cis-trans isomerase SurA